MGEADTGPFEDACLPAWFLWRLCGEIDADMLFVATWRYQSNVASLQERVRWREIQVLSDPYFHLWIVFPLSVLLGNSCY
jgi:hypothetical protein